MEAHQYKTDADAEEFTHLLNIFHTFYKRENNLPASVHFFDVTHGLKEMQEFKKQSIESKDAYCEAYNKHKVASLLKVHKKIYYLMINDKPAYTSPNALKLLTLTTTYNMTNWDIKSESQQSDVNDTIPPLVDISMPPINESYDSENDEVIPPGNE